MTKARKPEHEGDWVYARAQYESGVVSVRNIALDIGMSESAVTSRAARHGWVRDPLGVARLRAEREAALAKADEDKKAEIIAITASMQSQVLVRHRKDIAAARDLVSLLLGELTTVSKNTEIFEELGQLMRSENERGVDKLNDAYRRVLGMGERTSAINTLATALKTLIMLERQAYNIEGALEDPEATKPQAEVVRGLDKIMDKFNEVLALQAPAPTPTPMVIDVSGQSKAAATVSAV